jgi:hypothetical protein
MICRVVYYNEADLKFYSRHSQLSEKTEHFDRTKINPQVE